MKVSVIPQHRTLNPPASAQAIVDVSRFLPAKLPEDYAALLAQADGVAADHFTLYSCEELPERNTTFAISQYAPGFVIIGGDGGGSALVMRGGPGHSPLFLVGHGDMQPARMVLLAGSLVGWIESGCPVDTNTVPDGGA